ncbi:MAG: flagellar biosynthetic protein FliO [Zoogloeaceae bacterium]|nr:flagellar biosynthetic protein FliO [Zoogloeaceae bacterium]
MRRFLPVLLAALPGIALAQSAPAAVPDAGASLFQVFFGLGVVLATLVGGLWLLKRVSAPRGGAAGALRVIAGTSVGPRERVVLLEVEDTWLVVGVAPGQVNTLHQMPKGTLAAAPAAPAGKDFGAWLRQITERRHAG